VREARDRAEVLLHEVNHRVANSLALVAAFVSLQAQAVSDPSVRSALAEINNRIYAIAGVHRHLYSSKDVRVVEISDYLAILLRDLEATFRQAGHASKVRLTAERVEVPTDNAVSIGIVVTELITNAFKYAYPNNEAGEIRVRLAKSGSDKAILSVEDDGIGWTGEGAIKGTGAGRGIINDLARGLGSHITYDAARRGCRASLEFEI
jgi:two-component sensor histidine kinase